MIPPPLIPTRSNRKPRLPVSISFNKVPQYPLQDDVRGGRVEGQNFHHCPAVERLPHHNIREDDARSQNFTPTHSSKKHPVRRDGD